jgi:thiamine transport system permease protein
VTLLQNAARPGRESIRDRRTDSLIHRLLLWSLPLAFLGALFFLPLGRILALSLNFEALTAANLGLVYSVLRFTFWQALLSTVLTLLLGLPSAYLFARYDFRGKSLLRALTAVPFLLPTVVAAAGFNALLGPRGWLNLVLMQALGLEAPPIHFVGSLAAIVLAHVFYNTTIVIRVVGNALAHLDPKLEQAARSLGAAGGRLWWNVTLPLLRSSLLAASLLVFLFDFTSFGVILLLGGPAFATLEVEIYIQTLQLLNLPLSALLALVQLLCTLALSSLYVHFAGRASVQSGPRPAQSNLRVPRGLGERSFAAGMLALLFAVCILPMLALPLRSVSRLETARGERAEVRPGLSLAYYSELFVNRRGSIFYVPPVRAAANSLAYAGLTVVLALLLGFPAASALARPGRLERILDPLIMLPLGASTVMLGLGFILTFGRLLAQPWLVPLAHTLVALPFVIRTLQPAIASIPDRLRQAAASLGAPPWRVWQAVDWPILRRATLGAATFAFTISLGEFGATSLLARPEYPTIPIAIYRFLSQPGGSNYGQAMAMATLLMSVAVLGIFMIERLRLPGLGEF